MKYIAEVLVSLKDGVRDPQGSAIDTVLKRTGMEVGSEVHVGKFFTLTVSAENEPEARKKLAKICEEVLLNPILESYRIGRLEIQ
jgi:phosphoribosylformylglycinamidine synthase subunit PurS